MTNLFDKQIEKIAIYSDESFQRLEDKINGVLDSLDAEIFNIKSDPKTSWDKESLSREVWKVYKNIEDGIMAYNNILLDLFREKVDALNLKKYK